MTPGRVDLEVVGDRLSLVEGYLQRLRRIPSRSLTEFTADSRNVDASESLLRRAIEGLLDVARHLLAKGHGVAALEYREIARLACECGLVPLGDASEAFRRMAGYRIRLTHHYEEVTADEIFGLLRERLDDIDEARRPLARAARSLAEAGQ